MKTKMHNKIGGVLVLVMALVLVMGGLGAGLMKLGAGASFESTYAISDANAFWAAEAGMERAKTIGQMKRKGYSVILHPSGSGTLIDNVLKGTNSASKATYVVSIVDDPDWINNKALKKYIIISEGISQGGSIRTNKIKAKLLNYAGYMHASHLENGVAFATGDRIDGPVHTDDQIHIRGTPLFTREVSSSTNKVDYKTYSGSAWNPTANQIKAIFTNGITLNVKQLDIQGQFGDHIADMHVESQSGGVTLDGSAAGNYNFTFKSDGSVVYSNRSTHVVDSRNLSALTGPIYVNGDVYVQGVVKGNVTLAAQRNVYIASNIVYESASGAHLSPWASSFNINNVTDMLGLMASNSVVIQNTNSIQIHASIMITGGGLGATNWDQNIGNKTNFVFGGISQYSRGSIGKLKTVGSTTTFLGFHKNYKFDTRFEDDAPKSFPPSFYEFSSWQ